MNRQEFHALVIDHHFGELPPEAAKLLEAYLAVDAFSRAEAEQILATLAITHRAVLMHPELARTPAAVIEQHLPHVFESWFWLARAAAVLFLAMLTGLGGYWVGRNHSSSSIVATEPASPTLAKNSPWTRYRIASNPEGPGFQIVRLNDRGSTRVR